MDRQCIYPKDVQNLLGKSERYGRQLIKRIKEVYNKEDHQVVTIEEFCDFLGLNYEKVKSSIAKF